MPWDEAHLIAAAHHVELNPVRAHLVRVPGEYLWSSSAAHIAGQNADLVKVAPLLGMVEGWSAFLAEETATEHVELLRLHERTGRPVGSDEFIGLLEKTIGRRLRRKRPGPKRTIEGNYVWCTRNSVSKRLFPSASIEGQNKKCMSQKYS
jgi:putative transposase